MDSEKLRQLLGQPEGLKLDFKRKLYEINHPEPQVRERHWHEFIKDVLALANGNVGVAERTGYLIIGAADELKADGPRDLYDVGDVRLTSKQILQKVNAACNPPLPDVHCDTVELEGHRVFIVSIPPTPHLHETTKRLETSGGKTYSQSTVFIRRGEEIRPASMAERRAIRADKQGSGLQTTAPIVLPQSDVSTFTGRDEQLTQIEQLLVKRQEPKVRRIVGLTGSPGIGKSALAVTSQSHIELTSLTVSLAYV